MKQEKTPAALDPGNGRAALRGDFLVFFGEPGSADRTTKRGAGAAKNGQPVRADAQAALAAPSTVSLIAAATFGCLNEIGGERNWDYRHTWLRDSSFSLLRPLCGLALLKKLRALRSMDPQPDARTIAEHGPAAGSMYRGGRQPGTWMK